MEKQQIFIGVGAIVALILVALFIACRIWKRNRYYKKVQHSLDEEERAFQETLARSYADDVHLDGGDVEKLKMLETYMSVQGGTLHGGSSPCEKQGPAEDAPMPTRAEDVDKVSGRSGGTQLNTSAILTDSVFVVLFSQFMAELAAAAAGSHALAPAEENP